MYYTNVLVDGNNILERYVGEDGTKGQRKISFEPTMYIKSQAESKYKSIYGENVVPKKFANIRDCKDFIKRAGDLKREVLGMENFALQYIEDIYGKNNSYPLIRQLEIAFVDIEVPTRDGFPDPEVAKWEIDAIGHYSLSSGKYDIFTTRSWCKNKSALTVDDKGEPNDVLENVTYHKFETEKELLIAYLKFWRNNIPDIISGWNSDAFDIPTIVRRYQKVLGEKFANKLSPWDKIKERQAYDESGNEFTEFTIVGVDSIDYMKAYKKFTFVNRPTYKLDYIGSVELGMKKMPMPFRTYLDFAEKDPQKYIDYLIRDVQLLAMLDKRLNLSYVITSLAYYSGINFSDTFSPVKTWDAIINKFLIEQNIIVSQKKRKEKVKYVGAYVKDPLLQLYKWLLSFDLTSLKCMGLWFGNFHRKLA